MTSGRRSSKELRSKKLGAWKRVENEEELLTENYGLIKHVLFKLNIFSDDCEQQGAIGLLKAIRTYKPEMNFTFATYASKCIQNEILMFLRSDNRYIVDSPNYDTETYIEEIGDLEHDLDFECFLSTLSPAEYAVAQAFLSDKTKLYIINEMHVGRSELQRLINRIKLRYIEYKNNSK